MDLVELRETFEFLDEWEDRYRFIIDLGKSLPEFPAHGRNDENLVRGCQSQVWLIATKNQDGTFTLQMDSDAHIVRGLIAIVLLSLDGKTATEIIATDVNQLFTELELLQHLSVTRGNGLMAMLDKIRAIAASSEQ